MTAKTGALALLAFPFLSPIDHYGGLCKFFAYIFGHHKSESFLAA